jgi:hypothetical protein
MRGASWGFALDLLWGRIKQMRAWVDVRLLYLVQKWIEALALREIESEIVRI